MKEVLAPQSVPLQPLSLPLRVDTLSWESKTIGTSLAPDADPYFQRGLRGRNRQRISEQGKPTTNAAPNWNPGSPIQGTPAAIQPPKGSLPNASRESRRGQVSRGRPKNSVV
jgi:hypothetical protein